MSRWYKRCGADFIHGTMMLTLEEKGAYSLCLDLIYDRGGPIPDDARWLSGVCGVSTRKWSAIRDKLIELGKIVASGGMISNSRADFELVSSELHARKLAESGAKGGRKRAENAAASNENSGLAEAPLKLYREDKSREEEPPVAPLKGAAPAIGFPVDWEMPDVASLTPKARACAEQWTAASYETAHEAFCLHWRNSRKRRPDWRGTWCVWVIREHAKVMRDQKFGNAAPDAKAAPLSRDEQITELKNRIEFYTRIGRDDDVRECRRKIARLEGASAVVATLARQIGRAA